MGSSWTASASGRQRGRVQRSAVSNALNPMGPRQPPRPPRPKVGHSHRPRQATDCGSLSRVQPGQPARNFISETGRIRKFDLAVVDPHDEPPIHNACTHNIDCRNVARAASASWQMRPVNRGSQRVARTVEWPGIARTLGPTARTLRGRCRRYSRSDPRELLGCHPGGGWFHSIQPPPVRPSALSNRARARGKRARRPSAGWTRPTGEKASGVTDRSSPQ